jgi:hypothetical protein
MNQLKQLTQVPALINAWKFSCRMDSEQPLSNILQQTQNHGPGVSLFIYRFPHSSSFLLSTFLFPEVNPLITLKTTEMTRARNMNWNKLPKIDPGKKVVYPNPYPKPPNGEKTGGENTEGATTTVVLLTEGRIVEELCTDEDADFLALNPDEPPARPEERAARACSGTTAPAIRAAATMDAIGIAIA